MLLPQSDLLNLGGYVEKVGLPRERGLNYSALKHPSPEVTSIEHELHCALFTRFERLFGVVYLDTTTREVDTGNHKSFLASIPDLELAHHLLALAYPAEIERICFTVFDQRIGYGNHESFFSAGSGIPSICCRALFASPARYRKGHKPNNEQCG